MLTVIAGEGIATVGGEPIPIAADMGIVVPPCTPHGYRNMGAGPLRLVITLADADARLGEPVDLGSEAVTGYRTHHLPLRLPPALALSVARLLHLEPRERAPPGSRSLLLAPIEPGAAVPAPQRALGDLPPAGRAGPGSADARSYDANEEIEPHPQAREEGAEHHGPLGARSAARLSSIARRTSALLPHNEVRTTPAKTRRTAARARQRPTQTA